MEYLKIFRKYFLFLTVISLLLGCTSDSHISKKLLVTERNSLLGPEQGKVLVITNISPKTIFHLKCRIGESETLISDRLVAEGTAEVGWMELGRPLEPGQVVVISCHECQGRLVHAFTP